MSTTLKQQVLDLRSKGLSYDKISEELGCTKSVIAYHCNSTTKNKTLEKQRIRRASHEAPLISKLERFKNSKPKKIRENSEPNLSGRSPDGWKVHNLINKIGTFTVTHGDFKNPESKKWIPADSHNFTWQELETKCGSKCYLTGKDLDLSKANTYQLDHIIPRSKGGPNTLDNCAITCRNANLAKSDMSLDEFFQLCIDVVKHNNLKVD